jgi:cell division transport system ATP-binding protein
MWSLTFLLASGFWLRLFFWLLASGFTPPLPSPPRYHHRYVIHFYHVTKRFDRDHVALQDVSFQIEKGEFVFLSGASGAGKSTLLRLILRQLVPTEGQILVNGRNLAALKRVQLPFFRREIGMVFQDFKLIERMTVFENLSFVMTVLGIPAKEQKRKAYAVLRAVNLQQRLNAYPRQLSGGEQQRVAIARALINDPRVLVADEPTGNLDPELAREILRIFLDANVRGSTVLMASHNEELIRGTGKRKLTLDKGRLIDQRPSEPDLPPPERSGTFLSW